MTKTQKTQKRLSIRNILILVFCVLALILSYILAYAAATSYKGHIEVTVLNSETMQPIHGALVGVKVVGAPFNCSPSEKPTLSTGVVSFFDCPAYSTGRKKYKLSRLEAAGYITAGSSSYRRLRNGFWLNVRGRKGTSRHAKITVYMVPEKQDAASGGTGANNGNIIQATTHHNTRYRNSIPDPSWISIHPNSYYLGSVFNGWTADLVKLRTPGISDTENPSGYMFGQIKRPDGSILGCGWLEPGSVKAGTRQAQTNQCSGHKWLEELVAGSLEVNEWRKDFGIEFNCDHDGSSSCNAPITVQPHEINLSCNNMLYRNYFVNNDYKGIGRFQDEVASIDLTKGDALRYRYTTYDGKAAAVASADTPQLGGYGWGFIDKNCIKGYPKGAL